jgi:hypothetical protein
MLFVLSFFKTISNSYDEEGSRTFFSEDCSARLRKYLLWLDHANEESHTLIERAAKVNQLHRCLERLHSAFKSFNPEDVQYQEYVEAYRHDINEGACLFFGTVRDVLLLAKKRLEQQQDDTCSATTTEQLSYLQALLFIVNECLHRERALTDTFALIKSVAALTWVDEEDSRFRHVLEDVVVP